MAALQFGPPWNRHVCRHGMIKVDGEKLFLSTSLAGWSVGLKPIDIERLDVWFGRLLWGEVDLATSSFIRADIRPNKTADQSKNV